MSAALSERSWCVMVPHRAFGARTARRRMAAELADAIPSGLLADVMSVAAELVGNAIRHADPLPGDMIRVAWRLQPGVDVDLVEIRVTDGGAGAAPTLRSVGPEALNGRGLQIVAALATRWGVERDGLGQSVWAEISAPTDPGLAVIS